MLDCRRCKVKDCDCGRYLLGALNIISNYGSEDLVDEVEELLEQGLAECDDYEAEDVEYGNNEFKITEIE